MRQVTPAAPRPHRRSSAWQSNTCARAYFLALLATVTVTVSAAPTAASTASADFHADAQTPQHRPLHVLIATIKARGHVNLLLGTSRALLCRGHNVTLFIDEPLWDDAGAAVAATPCASTTSGTLAFASRGFTTDAAHDADVRRTATDGTLWQQIEVIERETQGMVAGIVEVQRRAHQAQKGGARAPAAARGGTAAQRRGVSPLDASEWPPPQAAEAVAAGATATRHSSVDTAEMAARGPIDVVVCDMAAMTCPVAGEVLGVPSVLHTFLDEDAMSVAPLHMSSSPSATAPVHLPLARPRPLSGRLLNDIGQRAATAFFMMMDSFSNEDRRHAGLPPAHLPGHGRLDAAIICSVHGLVAPVWRPPTIHVVGPTMLPRDVAIAAAPLTPNIERWLDGAGEAGVVYVAFGTTVVLKPHIVRAILYGLAAVSNASHAGDAGDAADRRVGGAPLRVLWALPKSQRAALPVSPDGRDAWPSSVMLVDWAPQVAVMAHRSVRCVVTHCGAGSVAEVLREGLPILAIPHLADQRMFAARVAGHGAGIIVDPADATAEVLQASATSLLRPGHNRYRDSARWFATAIGRSRGGEGAADVLEDVVYLGSEHTAEFVLSPPVSMLIAPEGDVMAIYAVALAFATLLCARCLRCLRCCGVSARGGRRGATKAHAD